MKKSTSYVGEIIIGLFLFIWIAGNIYSVQELDKRTRFHYYSKSIDTVQVCYKSVNLKITASLYQPDTAQCDDSPFKTAMGDSIVESSYYYWVAVSRDLINDYVNKNDIIHVRRGNNTYKFIVKDNMKSNWYRKIDIVVPLGDWKVVYTDKSNPLYTFFTSKEKIFITKIERN